MRWKLCKDKPCRSGILPRSSAWALLAISSLLSWCGLEEPSVDSVPRHHLRPVVVYWPLGAQLCSDSNAGPCPPGLRFSLGSTP